MSTRYQLMFDRLKEKGEGAFVPFCVVGDPDPELSLEIIATLAGAGADALELGLPFSDPVADGPVIQKADVRALNAGASVKSAFEIIKTARTGAPDMPIGLLVYANLVEAPGRDEFYRQARDAGVDSVLVADVPTIEAAPFVESASRHDIHPVLIAAPNCTGDHLARVAELTSGYTYVVTRAGVTGTDQTARTQERKELLSRLKDLGAPPSLLGFGISEPAHVREALQAGAAGAISGSAVVERIEKNLGDPEKMLTGLRTFVKSMKDATSG
jgi:tryptophan synthase alpha chain